MLRIQTTLLKRNVRNVMRCGAAIHTHEFGPEMYDQTRLEPILKDESTRLTTVCHPGTSWDIDVCFRNMPSHFQMMDIDIIIPQLRTHYKPNRIIESESLPEAEIISVPNDMSRTFNVENTELIFRSFSTLEIIQSSILFQLCTSQRLTNIGISTMVAIMNQLKKAMDASATQSNIPIFTQALNVVRRVTLTPIATAARKLVYPQFTGGESIAQCVDTSKKFAAEGIRLILDHSTEEATTLEKWNANAQSKIELAHAMIKNLTGQVAFLPIKMTSLMSPQLLKTMSADMRRQGTLNADPVANLTLTERAMLSTSIARLQQIISVAKSLGLRVTLDSERYELQHAMNWVAQQLFQEFNRNNQIWVYHTFQMYLKEAPNWLNYQLGCSVEKGYSVGVSLVRGAYLEQERAWAEENDMESPVWDNKAKTDETYDKMVSQILNQISAFESSRNDSVSEPVWVTNVGISINSHNRQSLENAMHTMEELKLPRDHPTINMAQLKGMCDNLTFGTGIIGYNSMKRVPFGNFYDVWPYLMRRLLENQDMLNGTTREKEYYKKEVKRRLLDLIPMGPYRKNLKIKHFQ